MKWEIGSFTSQADAAPATVGEQAGQAATVLSAREGAPPWVSLVREPGDRPEVFLRPVTAEGGGVSMHVRLLRHVPPASSVPVAVHPDG